MKNTNIHVINDDINMKFEFFAENDVLPLESKGERIYKTQNTNIYNNIYSIM